MRISRAQQKQQKLCARIHSDKIEVVVVVISDSIAKKIVVDSLKTESNAVAPDSKIFVYSVLKAYDTRTKEMTTLHHDQYDDFTHQFAFF